MPQRTAYTIQCVNCNEQFPIVVLIDSEKKTEQAITKREVECPLCQAQLTFQLDQPIAEVEYLLRSYKKNE